MLPVISNAAVTSASGSFFKYGDQVQFECASGYTKNGELTGAKTFEIPCLMTGRFENTNPSCSPISCGTAPVKDNAQRSSILPIGFGEQVSYVCNDGYLAGGVYGVTIFAASCAADGSVTFASANPTCQPISCGAAPAVNGAALFWLGDMVNGVIPVQLKYGDADLLSHCENSGEYLDGSRDNGLEEQISCRSNGAFSNWKHCAPAIVGIAGVADDAQDMHVKIAAATVTIKKDGVVVSTETTDNSGIYRGRAREGENEIHIVKDGYITVSKLINVSGPIALGQGADVSMSKVLGAGEWRITVTWGKFPLDLDSHIYFGKERLSHVYYRQTSDTADNTGGLQVVLDRDDTESYGPETTTISNCGACTTKGYCQIYFEVENYTPENGTLAASKGVIKVYKATQVYGTYPIPDQLDGATDFTEFSAFTLDCTRGKETIYEGAKFLPPFISDGEAGLFKGSSTSWGNPNEWGQVDPNSLIYGLNRGSTTGLSAMNQVKYYKVQTNGFTPDLGCKQVDWASSLKGWSECPAGYFLADLIRNGTNPDTVSQITQARCCKAVELPSEWGACYEQPSFTEKNNFSECSLDSSGEARAVVGIHRSDATDITGIDKFKCCIFKDIGLVSQSLP